MREARERSNLVSFSGDGGRRHKGESDIYVDLSLLNDRSSSPSLSEIKTSVSQKPQHKVSLLNLAQECSYRYKYTAHPFQQ